jgi:thioredoxin reductase
MEETIYDVAIIGGGIVGAATFTSCKKEIPNCAYCSLKKKKNWPITKPDTILV